MNRLVRLLLVWLAARRALRRTPPGQRPSAFDEGRTPLRVMPNDLDLLRHMNNGSFLTLMDIGRVDMMVRCGAQAEVARRGWYPVVVGESIRFRRSLVLWERFEIVTRVVGWDERVTFVEQRFERRGRDGSPEVVAEAWVVARFLARRGGSVPPADVATSFGLDGPSPALPADLLAWARSLDLAHREPDATRPVEGQDTTSR
ncbi:acyl-CoA thioesterase [Cellulomonas sp. P22]|uniref:acyl-CoA thioesterase n=1 Tax=Cellulomonas sp. P22 TaxID=3373189 RepID=UPI00378F388F